MKKGKKPKVNLHKKDDDKGDEESKGFMENSMQEENKQKIDALENSVTAIKQMSKGIGSHL